MKALHRLLSIVAAGAISLCLLTACGSSDKFDTSIFIKTIGAKTGYELKESSALNNALSASLNDIGTNFNDKSALSSAITQAVATNLGDPNQNKYQYVSSATIVNNLKALDLDKAPVAAYTIYADPIEDFGSGKYRTLNSAQLYYISWLFTNRQKFLFDPQSNQHQPSSYQTGRTTSYVPEEVSVKVKTITVDGKETPYVFVVLKGTMSFDA